MGYISLLDLKKWDIQYAVVTDTLYLSNSVLIEAKL